MPAAYRRAHAVPDDTVCLTAVYPDHDNEQSTLRLRRTIQGHRPAGDDAHLIVLVGHTMGRRYALGQEFELGRGPQCPIDLHDDGVSRRHAAIRRADDGSYVVRDLGSRNGTFVNGRRIDEVVLKFGDKIAVGSQTVLLFANRDRFEDQRIQAQKLQALGQLAGGVAHDFNNLLGVVLANITHLQQIDRFDEDTVRKTLDEVETAARRAVDLTHQLLAFARSSARKHEPLDVGQLIHDVERLLRRTLHRSIELETKDVTELAVIGDASQLLQVLMNLCINAGDAMPNGGMLTIDASAREIGEEDRSDVVPAGRYAVIRVSDEGIGMDAETCARIFEPFFTTKPRGKGTGLGLATAYAIVRDHGGYITVESEPGRGTIFELFLPASEVTPAEKQRMTEESWRPTRGTVMLADDEPLVLQATTRVLQHAGLEVLTAVDGQAALELYADHRERIDLVILDLDMPRLNGEQAFARLKADDPQVRVLISSGYVDHEREAALRHAGVDGILHKPYDSMTLLQAIGQTIRIAPLGAKAP